MDQKCWFVLRQTHYPPPIFPENGVGESSGPICLGHLIPDLHHLDNIINLRGPEPIPPDMPIYHTGAREMTWNQNIGGNINRSVGFDAPVAAGVGVTASASAGIAFKRSVSNFARFNTLDTYITQVSQSYIEDSISTDEVSKYIQEHSHLKRWSLFMVTGIVIARGASTCKSEGRGSGVQGGLGAGLQGLAGVNLDIEYGKQNESVMSSEDTSDFVWAIRLAKISKGILSKVWTYKTFSKGATYGTTATSLYRIVDECLSDEGIEKDRVVIGDEGDDVFVI